MLNYFGFLLYRWFFLGLGFVSLILVLWKVVYEYWVLIILCIVIVDFNVLLWNILLFVLGNDDLIVCLNYYCFIIVRSILLSKSWNMFRFKMYIKGNKIDKIYLVGVKKKKMLLVILYSRKYDFKCKICVWVNIEYFKEINLVDKIMWEFKYLMFDMVIFSIEYSVFLNFDFFKFFDLLFIDFFKLNKDLIFYNDFYRIY